MDIRQIESVINEHLELITVDAKGLANAKDRAAKFLVACSILSSCLKDFESERAKISTIVDASYAQAMRTVEGRNVTEKKAFVEEDSEYSTNKQAMIKMDALKDWIKTHIKIFENAHLMFRQYSRE